MSTEVKPSDWNEDDNRWEPTPGGGGGGIPTPTAQDSGKVLTAGADGTASWETPSGDGIPPYTMADAGAYLSIHSEFRADKTIVPEQTQTVEDGNLFPENVAIQPSDMHVGDTAYLVVKERDLYWLLTVVDAGSGFGLVYEYQDDEESNEFSLMYYQNTWIVSTSLTGQLTYSIAEGEFVPALFWSSNE